MKVFLNFFQIHIITPTKQPGHVITPAQDVWLVTHAQTVWLAVIVKCNTNLSLDK